MDARIARLDDLPSSPSDLVEAEWKPVRHALGISAFGTNAYVARAAGELLIEDHSEARSGYEELYVVLRGSVDFTVEKADGEDRTVTLEAGALVFVPPGRGRAARARSAGAAVLVVGAVPGRAFTPSAWETRRLPP